jgi:RNA polymerase sigma-70 factor, ECF subfamily
MSGDLFQAALMPSDARIDERPCDPDTTYAALAVRARAGDAEAFDRLMVLTQRKVVATAWRLLGNREDARDAAQETFLRAFKYLDRYDSRHDFQGWLHQITVNVCRDAARKRGAAHPSLDAGREAGGFDLAAGADDTERGVLRAQERAIVARAIAALPHKERAALVLRDIENLPTEEVARRLGSRPVTVRSQISSARSKVRRYCERLLEREGKR